MSWQGRWTVKGRLDGADVLLAWDDGRLSGTDAAVQAVSAVLESGDQVQLSPQDEPRAADVHDSHAVMAAVQQVLEIVQVDGDPPIPDADSSAS